MSVRTSMFLHVGTMVLGVLALWLFVFPGDPGAAVRVAIGATLMADGVVLMATTLLRWH